MRYQVIVGNVGTVVDTNSRFEASDSFREYKRIVRLEFSRAYNETVILMCEGEIIKEYDPVHDREIM